VITVNDSAPSSLSYTSPNVFTKNVAITPLSPSVSGGAVVSYSIAPALPFGLSFDTASGVISGTPSVISGSSYLYRDSYQFGWVDFFWNCDYRE
jgi:hypothetical protein